MRHLTTAIAFAFSNLIFLGSTLGQEPKPIATFMRAKLTHSQKVLEGLATEDYEMIMKAAEEMRLLSLASQWQVLQTAEYTRRSGEFRRAASGLKEAAKTKNLDGATLAFVGVAMKCVDCHKYVRSVKNARLDLPLRKFRLHQAPWPSRPQATRRLGPRNQQHDHANTVAGVVKDESSRFGLHTDQP